MKRPAFLAALAIVLGGCVAYQVGPADSEIPTATRIRDLRPAIERDGKLLPYGRDICADMLADNKFQPERLAILEHRFLQIQPHLSAIELDNFSVVLLCPRTTPLDHLIYPNMPTSVKGITDFSTTWIIVELKGHADSKAFFADHAERVPRGAFGRQHEIMQKALYTAIERAINMMPK